MSKSTISTFQLFELFPDQESAREYLELRLWPNGVVCPVCKSGERITARKAGYYRCNACKEDFTVRTGTIFERSHVPLHKWIHCLMLLIKDSDMPTQSIGRALDVSQPTAWGLRARLREAAGYALMSPDRFRVVEGWPAYRVGADGSIWTRWAKGRGGRLGNSWRLLRPTIDTDGYRTVRLYGEAGAWKQRRVCRLVCEAFNGPCQNRQECRHRDGNSANDAAGNLTWGTSRENKADMKAHGTQPYGLKHGNGKLSEQQVADIRALKGQRLQREVAAYFGITQGYVSELWAESARARY